MSPFGRGWGCPSLHVSLSTDFELKGGDNAQVCRGPLRNCIQADRTAIDMCILCVDFLSACTEQLAPRNKDTGKFGGKKKNMFLSMPDLEL